MYNRFIHRFGRVIHRKSRFIHRIKGKSPGYETCEFFAKRPACLSQRSLRGTTQWRQGQKPAGLGCVNRLTWQLLNRDPNPPAPFRAWGVGVWSLGLVSTSLRRDRANPARYSHRFLMSLDCFRAIILLPLFGCPPQPNGAFFLQASRSDLFYQHQVDTNSA